MRQVNEFGWDGLPDEGYGYDGMIGSIGAMHVYVPDLGPVGSGSQGTYYPRNTEEDARALGYLGFFDAFIDHTGTLGSQQADMANDAGAWDPAFQEAVAMFQASVGLPADGWIGPNTRRALAAAVLKKNAEGPMPSPLPIPPPPPPPLPNILPVPPSPIPVPPSPGPLPGPVPQPVVTKENNTMKYLAIGGGGLLLVALGAYALAD
jgi:hypothetical protein